MMCGLIDWKFFKCGTHTKGETNLNFNLTLTVSITTIEYHYKL